MRNILITGAAGFIGTNFTYYWLDKHQNDHVIGLDALTYAGNPENLAPAKSRKHFEFIHGDIRDIGLIRGLIREKRIDAIVHFAAESHVDRSIADPDAFIQTNVIGTYTLLEAVRKLPAEHGRPHFHHVSTDEVYGSLEPDESPFSESNRYAPNSPYAASKAASDHLVRAYARTYNIKATISNCSNNYGPYQFPEKLIPLTLVNLLTDKTVPVYGDGLNVRDWLFVEDHCHGIGLILEKGNSGETYNIGGGAEIKNIDLVEELCRIVNEMFATDRSLSTRFPHAPAAQGNPSRSLIKYVADRPGHDRRYAIDTTKISRALGYRPAVSFTEGLRRTVEWYLGHEDWWQRVVSGEYLDAVKNFHWLSKK